MIDTIELDPGLVAKRVSMTEIPVIDIGPLLHGDAPARADVAAKIGAACRNIGFFYIVNHGVPAALVDAVFAETRRFFEQSEAAKAGIAIEQSEVHRGYFKIGGENLDPEKQTADGDLKEGIKIGRDLAASHPLVQAKTPLHGPNQWPQNLPGWREVMQEYYDVMEGLGRRLMRAFALALGLEEQYFDRWLKSPMTTLGPLHYPPQKGRIMLAQDAAGGLQVRNASGEWIDAPPIADSFVVNIGDMMERWTNGVFTSTLHRVVNVSGLERYSLPYFFDPDFNAEVVCLETCLEPGETPKYPPTTSGRHLLDMINASFEYHKEKAR
jgi:isopenicillin N synthase-like dioxygenase